MSCDYSWRGARRPRGRVLVLGDSASLATAREILIGRDLTVRQVVDPAAGSEALDGVPADLRPDLHLARPVNTFDAHRLIHSTPVATAHPSAASPRARRRRGGCADHPDAGGGDQIRINGERGSVEVLTHAD